MKTLKNPAVSGERLATGFINTGANDSTKTSTVKPGTKEHVVLSVLAEGKSLNRFEAIRLHDTALNSTVSTLQGKGLFIHRERETVPCVNGSKTADVMRYSLTPDQILIAQRMLGIEVAA